MQGQQGAAGAAGAGGAQPGAEQPKQEDDVVDADFKEVKDAK